MRSRQINTSVRIERRSSTPAKTVFRVLENVGEYPEFIPWCESISMLEASNDLNLSIESEVRQFPVIMGMRMALIRARAKCMVTVDRARYEVGARHLDGPLAGTMISWRVKENGGDVVVEFEAALKSSSPVLRVVAGGMTEHIVRVSADAFERRAMQEHRKQQA